MPSPTNAAVDDHIISGRPNQVIRPKVRFGSAKYRTFGGSAEPKINLKLTEISISSYYFSSIFYFLGQFSLDSCWNQIFNLNFALNFSFQ